MEPVSFGKKGAKDLEEICGCKAAGNHMWREAPYLVSRYDSVSGKTIPVSDRIGFI